MRGIALGLELPERYFDNYYDKSYWILRTIHYPGTGTLPQSIDRGNNAGFGCGEHTDYGCLTIINSDETRGALEALNAQGEWVKADPIEGAFVCNIGDMLSRWTNGEYVSTPHRVLHPSQPRTSVPFLFEPNYDAVVAPLEHCGTSGSAGKFPPIKYGDHLASKTSANF
jgi:isopenicillin N synthase-like dioxygenase